MPSLAKRLTWEAPAENIKIRDTGLRIYLSYISRKVLIFVSEYSLIRTVIKVMPVCLSGRRIPFASKYTLSALSVIKRYVKSANTSEKIDEPVWGLLGHNLLKHIFT